MEFLDDFVIPVSDNQAYRLLGNSMVPRVVERIAKELVCHLHRKKITVASIVSKRRIRQAPIQAV